MDDSDDVERALAAIRNAGDGELAVPEHVRALEEDARRAGATAEQVEEAAAERATAEFADAEDADERALLKDAAMAKRADAKRERSRADAALDALNDETAPDPKAAARALRERITDAGEDVRMLNAALREGYEALALFHTDDGVRIVPALLADESMDWLLSEPTGDGSTLPVSTA